MRHVVDLLRVQVLRVRVGKESRSRSRSRVGRIGTGRIGRIGKEAQRIEVRVGKMFFLLIIGNRNIRIGIIGVMMMIRIRTYGRITGDGERRHRFEDSRG